MFTFVRSKNRSRWIDLPISCSRVGLFLLDAVYVHFYCYFSNASTIGRYADIIVNVPRSADLLPMQDTGVDK